MNTAARTDYSDKRVILVDDNAALRGLLRAALQSFGFKKVIEAESVARALELIAIQQIDLVITDWKMSPRDGIDLVRELRRPQTSPAPFVPVMMLTAYSDGEHIKQARDAGATAFLVKPFTPAALAVTIREAFEDEREFIQTSDFFGPDRRGKPRAEDRRHPLIAAS